MISGELGESSLEVFYDLGGDDVGIRKVGTVFERPILQPKDVEVEFVALGYLFVSEALEALGFFSVVAIFWIVAGDEVIEVAAL